FALTREHGVLRRQRFDHALELRQAAIAPRDHAVVRAAHLLVLRLRVANRRERRGDRDLTRDVDRATLARPLAAGQHLAARRAAFRTGEPERDATVVAAAGVLALRAGLVRRVRFLPRHGLVDLQLLRVVLRADSNARLVEAPDRQFRFCWFEAHR